MMRTLMILPIIAEKLPTSTAVPACPPFNFRPIMNVLTISPIPKDVPRFVKAGSVLANDVAVFTAMCMCWSGYLSTHVAMMSSLKVNKLTGKAILSHTIGGLCAGVVANWIFKLVMLFL